MVVTVTLKGRIHDNPKSRRTLRYDVVPEIQGLPGLIGKVAKLKFGNILCPSGVPACQSRSFLLLHSFLIRVASATLWYWPNWGSDVWPDKCAGHNFRHLMTLAGQSRPKCMHRIALRNCQQMRSGTDGVNHFPLSDVQKRHPVAIQNAGFSGGQRGGQLQFGRYVRRYRE